MFQKKKTIKQKKNDKTDKKCSCSNYLPFHAMEVRECGAKYKDFNYKDQFQMCQVKLFNNVFSCFLLLLFIDKLVSYWILIFLDSDDAIIIKYYRALQLS